MVWARAAPGFYQPVVRVPGEGSVVSAIDRTTGAHGCHPSVQPRKLRDGKPGHSAVLRGQVQVGFGHPPIAAQCSLAGPVALIVVLGEANEK